MNSLALANREQAEVIRSLRKPYTSPLLRAFGKLHCRTQGTGGNGTDQGVNQTKMSDRRAKAHVVRVGTHPLGIGLYLFDYLPIFGGSTKEGREFGVMADEVEQVLPSAVTIGPDGYRRVDYRMLGIDLTVH